VLALVLVLVLPPLVVLEIALRMRRSISSSTLRVADARLSRLPAVLAPPMPPPLSLLPLPLRPPLPLPLPSPLSLSLLLRLDPLALLVLLVVLELLLAGLAPCRVLAGRFTA
jgi:hypothetical protein